MLCMSRPGHPLTLKALLIERRLKEIPASSDSKSLLFKALDMTEDLPKYLSKDSSKDKHLPKPGLHSPQTPYTFSPLSPLLHISVKFYMITSTSKMEIINSTLTLHLQTSYLCINELHFYFEKLYVILTKLIIAFLV